MLCNACARGTSSHLYQIDPKSFAIAFPITLAAAVFGGWLMVTIGSMGFFAALFAYLYGMGIGELALRLTGRKRGLPMEIMVGACVLIGLIAGFGMVVALSAGAAPSEPNGTVADAATPATLILLHLRNPWTYLMAAVGVFGAVSRVRTIG